MIVERSNLWVSRDISIYQRQFKKIVHFLGKNTHKNFFFTIGTYIKKL